MPKKSKMTATSMEDSADDGLPTLPDLPETAPAIGPVTGVPVEIKVRRRRAMNSDRAFAAVSKIIHALNCVVDEIEAWSTKSDGITGAMAGDGLGNLKAAKEQLKEAGDKFFRIPRWDRRIVVGDMVVVSDAAFLASLALAHEGVDFGAPRQVVALGKRGLVVVRGFGTLPSRALKIAYLRS